MALPQELYDRLNAGLARFAGAMVCPSTIYSIVSTAHAIREEFLYAYPNYVSAGEISWHADGNGGISVDCFVITTEEKALLEQITKHNETALEEAFQQELQRARRWKNMLRQYRRLSRKYAVPVLLAGVWDTLDEAQQYNILKRIDYDARHKIEEE